jgi:hypothetical protein
MPFRSPKAKKDSPLKSGLLRQAGQSLDERFNDLLLDRVTVPLLLAGFTIILAALEWVRTLLPTPPMPRVVSIVALVVSAGAAYRVWRSFPELQALREGRDGERAVGEYLERLRADGYRAFHDVIGDGFNIDHVLVGPAGVFTVETKTYSKTRGVEPKIRFDGEVITVAGFEPDRNPIVQARAQAAWLRAILQESTGQKLPVRPVLVYPGWFIEQIGNSKREIWVLNPKALPDFLRHERQSLPADLVHMASLHLGRYIRAR